MTESRRCSGWLGADGYVVSSLAAVVGDMFWCGDRSSPICRPRSRSADWQAWREDVRQQQTNPGPVKRRVPKSDEPPALVLMRDYFAVLMVGAVLFSSLLYWIMAWFVTGILRQRIAIELAARLDGIDHCGSTRSQHGSQPRQPQRVVGSGTIRWRSWPLVDRLALVMACAGRHSVRRRTWYVAWRRLAVWPRGSGAHWQLAMWQFLLPVTYEICSLGVRR